ncbi:hypothetical protein AB7Z95_21120 [Providencia rettgeri]
MKKALLVVCLMFITFTTNAWDLKSLLNGRYCPDTTCQLMDVYDGKLALVTYAMDGSANTSLMGIVINIDNGNLAQFTLVDANHDKEWKTYYARLQPRDNKWYIDVYNKGKIIEKIEIE